VSEPAVLDLYCGAGGAARGYQRAGFPAFGVDSAPQPRYAGDEFVQADALTFLRENMAWIRRTFVLVHASPPCQASCTLTAGTNRGRVYPQLIPQTRELLDEIGLPYVIENVVGAPIRKDVELCGEMFGLGVIRHRRFELGGWKVEQPEHVPHRGRVAGMRHGKWYEGPYFAVYGEGGGKGTVTQWQTAMDMHWTDVRKEIAEAIPPAYCEWLGDQLRAYLDALRLPTSAVTS